MLEAKQWKILSLILAAFFFLEGGVSATKGINAKEFSVLCRLGQIAEKGATLDEKTYMDSLATWDHVQDISKRIKYFVDQTNESTGAHIKIKSEDLVVDFPRNRGIHKIQAQLHHFAARLHKIQNELDQLRVTVTSNWNTAKGELEKAMGGTTGGLLGRGNAVAGTLTSATTHRPNACKTEGGTRTNVDSIPLDLLCLCADTASDDTSCGPVYGNSNVWGTGATYTNAAQGWTAIHTSCVTLIPNQEFSLSDLVGAVDDFYKVLGRQADAPSSSNFPQGVWILGKSKNNGDCDGTAGAGKCVNYAGGSCTTQACTMNPPKWLTSLKQAINVLEQNERTARKIKQYDANADAILNAAESVLVEANVSRYFESSPPAEGGAAALDKRTDSLTSNQNPGNPSIKSSEGTAIKVIKTKWILLSVLAV